MRCVTGRSDISSHNVIIYRTVVIFAFRARNGGHNNLPPPPPPTRFIHEQKMEGGGEHANTHEILRARWHIRWRSTPKRNSPVIHRKNNVISSRWSIMCSNDYCSPDDSVCTARSACKHRLKNLTDREISVCAELKKKMNKKYHTVTRKRFGGAFRSYHPKHIGTPTT